MERLNDLRMESCVCVVVELEHPIIFEIFFWEKKSQQKYTF